ncbi:hypothetical protein IT575_12030 [bacterium]|nr:hypothetical protein [bacterium]
MLNLTDDEKKAAKLALMRLAKAVYKAQNDTALKKAINDPEANLLNHLGIALLKLDYGLQAVKSCSELD